MTETTVSVPGLVVTASDKLAVPGDFDQLAPWFKVLRSIRHNLRGHSHVVVKLCVIVDEHNTPRHWLKPEVLPIEPKSRGQALEALLEALTA